MKDVLDTKEILTVVLSRNYSTGLSVIRSLGTKGYSVDLVASAPREGASEFISRSRFVRDYHEAVSKKVKEDDDPELLNILRAYKGQQETKPVLIPADDYTASIMDFNREELEDVFLMPGIIGGAPGSLVHMMDKSVQGALARKVGIKTPLEWPVSLRDEIVIPEDVVYPCFVKPLGSIGGYKQEMARCEDRDQLMAHLQVMKESFPHRSVLVQEFVNIDKEYDIEGVCLGDDVILSGVIYKEYVAQYDRGVPLYGDMQKLDILGDFIDKVKAFLKEFNYFGMFDLGINKVGDEFWFNELNLRSGGTNYVYFESGCNLSELFVKAALGMEISEDEKKIKEFGKKYIYEKVAWDDHFHGHLKKKELRGLIESADIHIMVNEYDPAPGEAFNETVHEEERKLRRKKLRDSCVAAAMEGAGWDKETARENIRDTRQRLGIGYKEYEEFKLWRYSPETQEEEYHKAVKRKERREKQKEQCIENAIAGTGWDRETALNNIRAARKLLDIGYKEYDEYKLWKYPTDELEEEYPKAVAKKEKIERQKEECIAHAMDLMGWDRDQARQQINEARKRLGVTYNVYRKNNFCLMTPEEQDREFEKIKLRKADK